MTPFGLPTVPDCEKSAKMLKLNFVERKRNHIPILTYRVDENATFVGIDILYACLQLLFDISQIKFLDLGPLEAFETSISVLKYAIYVCIRLPDSNHRRVSRTVHRGHTVEWQP